MEKLTIEHLAKHLPYGLEMYNTHDGRCAYNNVLKRRLKKVEILTCESLELLIFLNRKPILHPLLDLTKRIAHNKKNFTPLRELVVLDCYAYKEHSGFFNDMNDFKNITNKLPYWFVNEYLLKWHFDIDGLIEKGLAIDVNILEANPYK